MTDQGQPVEGDALSAMMGVLEAEETLGDPAPEVKEEITDPVDDTDETESEEEEVEEEASEEITWNGETKMLTKSQVKELAQQGFDYTQKTQAIAEERRSIQAQAQQLQAQVAIHTQLADMVTEVKSLDKQLAQYKGVDWGELIDQDPVQAMKLNQVFRDLKEAREAKVHEYNQQAQYLEQVQAQSQAQALQAEAQLLARKVPELTGEKAADNKAHLANYLRTEGFNDAEVNSIMDHRMVAVAWKAAQYDKLKAGKPAVNKRVAEVPKVVKGKPSNPNMNVRNDLKAKLKQTGRDEYAAKLIENML